MVAAIQAQQLCVGFYTQYTFEGLATERDIPLSSAFLIFNSGQAWDLPTGCINHSQGNIWPVVGTKSMVPLVIIPIL